MGIYRTENEESVIVYYLKQDKTYFIEMKKDGHAITFQVAEKVLKKKDLDNSGWTFESISHDEFEDYVREFKYVIDYDLLKLRKKHQREKEETFFPIDER